MMELHFKKGAVVRFFLKEGAQLNAVGKVEKVSKDMVEFAPQDYFSAYKYEQSWGTQKLDPTRSFDAGPVIHLDRSFIVAWAYEPVPNKESCTFYGVPQPDELAGMPMNEYGPDGYCHGDGEYFE